MSSKCSCSYASKCFLFFYACPSCGKEGGIVFTRHFMSRQSTRTSIMALCFFHGNLQYLEHTGRVVSAAYHHQYKEPVARGGVLDFLQNSTQRNKLSYMQHISICLTWEYVS